MCVHVWVCLFIHSFNLLFLERLNRTFNRYFHVWWITIVTDHLEWDDLLAAALELYNHRVHSQTRRTPFMAYFGRAPLRSPYDLNVEQLQSRLLRSGLYDPQPAAEDDALLPEEEAQLYNPDLADEEPAHGEDEDPSEGALVPGRLHNIDRIAGDGHVSQARVRITPPDHHRVEHYDAPSSAAEAILRSPLSVFPDRTPRSPHLPPRPAAPSTPVAVGAEEQFLGYVPRPDTWRVGNVVLCVEQQV